MSTRNPLRLLACFLPLLATELAANTAMSRALGQRIAEARRASPDLGVHVVEVESGAEIYGYHEDELQVLASNTKLFTTAAALDILGPDFRFETPLLIRGAVYDGTLGGDLAVVGSGDPSFSGRLFGGDSWAIFRSWAEALKARGVVRATGDLYLVRGLFEDRLLHPDWPTDQLTRWYEAPVDALSYNDNCIAVRISPGAHKGAPGKVELDPELGLYRVINRVVTGASARGHHLVVNREPGASEIVVSGNIWSASRPVEAWITVPNPTAYFGAALAQELARQGIVIEGSIKIVDALPGDVWERVAAHTTDLRVTIAVTNLHSQNFYAESLLKVLGARASGIGSWQEGVKAVAEFLFRAGLSGFELADGSGMSRGNRASPRHMTTLLRHMVLRPEGKGFMTSLPMAGGEEGTWAKHLREAPYAGNVFAKTGTLAGVSSLSGYARGLSGRLYAFSILCNQTGSVWRARQAQDAIVRAMVDFG